MLRSLQTNYVLRASRIIHRKSVEIFIRSLVLSRSHTLTFCRMNNVRPFVYSRVQECVCVNESFKITLTFIFSATGVFWTLTDLSGLYGLWANKWALLYWPHNDHSSVPYSLFATMIQILSHKRLHSCFIRRFDIYTSPLDLPQIVTKEKQQTTNTRAVNTGTHSTVEFRLEIMTGKNI